VFAAGRPPERPDGRFLQSSLQKRIFYLDFMALFFQNVLYLRRAETAAFHFALIFLFYHAFIRYNTGA